jgi:hypothetical protein
MRHGDSYPRDDYEDRNGGPGQLDRKNLTRACCVAGIAGKAQTGLSLYALHDQAPRLHGVLDQHHIMAEILAI